MSALPEKNVTIGEITLTAIGGDKFAVPGGGLIRGRANAIRAAKNIVKSNTKLRIKHNQQMRER